MFSWNPFYTIYSHEVRDYHKAKYPFTDNENDFVSLSLLRKNFTL